MPQHRQDNWWKRRTKLEKQLSCFAIVSLFLAVVLVVSFIFYKQYGEPMGTCLNAGCIHAASELLNNIDENVSPCENFYKFACGKFQERIHIPDDFVMFSPFIQIGDILNSQLRTILEDPITSEDTSSVKVVKKFYKACMNKSLIELDGLIEAKTLLNSLGGWPVLEEAWEEHTFDWIEISKGLKRAGLSFNHMIAISAGIDFKNSSKRILDIDQPSLGLKREYLMSGNNDKIVKAYYDLMVDFAIMFGADKFKATQELMDVLNFEISLAKISIAKNERRNIFQLYNIMTLGDMKTKYKHISWSKLLRYVLPADVKLYDGKEFLVQVPSYIEGLSELMDNTSKRVQSNYIFWRIVLQISEYLPQQFLDRLLRYKQITRGIKEGAPRWRDCVVQAVNNVPIILGSIYVRKHFNDEAKHYATELVKYILAEVKAVIHKLDWMDEVTRKKALEKADTIVGHIAYPNELLDDNKIEEYYSGLDVNENMYLQSFLNINKFTVDQNFHKLLEPVNKTSWTEHSYPVEVNAFYSIQDNSIILPAAILQGIFFNKDRPSYMNYGAIGSAIGHEIIHGFDDQGRQFDKDGNLAEWWKTETKQAFMEKAQCIIKQYNSYYVSEVSKNISGFKTQGENIADNGGTKAAYLAYSSWINNNGPEPKLPGLNYTPRQLFWISAAQVWCSKERTEYLSLQVTTDAHAPSEFRIIGTFSNSEQFAKDFNCPAGSKMNSKRKCSIW